MTKKILKNNFLPATDKKILNDNFTDIYTNKVDYSGTGNNSVWDDLRFPVTSAKLGILDKPDFDYTNNGLLFPQNDATEIIFIVAQLPHGYKLGTDIVPHLHYIQTGADLPTFKLKYRWYELGETIPVFTTITSTTNVFSYTSGTINNKLLFPPIVGSGITTISSILDIQIYREDNLVAGDILVKEFDIHYLSDTLGSYSSATK